MQPATRRCLTGDRGFLLDKTKCERFKFFKIRNHGCPTPRNLPPFGNHPPSSRRSARAEPPETFPSPITRCINPATSAVIPSPSKPAHHTGACRSYALRAPGRRNGEGKFLGKSVSERLTRGNLGRVPPSCHLRGACLKLTCGPRMAAGTGTKCPLGRGPTGRTPHC